VPCRLPSTVTYTYDHAIEPRGLATKTTDSVASVFQATLGLVKHQDADLISAGLVVSGQLDWF